MLRHLCSLATCLLTVPVFTTASAEGLGVGSNASINIIKFDDRTGKGFDWRKSLPCGSNHVRVTLTFKKAYQNEIQMSVAKIWLHAAKTQDTPEQWVAAAFSAPTDSYKLYSIEWLEKVEGSVSEGPGYAPVDLRAPLHIDITWNRAGDVTVNFGDNIIKHVKTNSPITDIGISVSWANFEFSDLKLDRFGPPDAACLTKPLQANVERPDLTLASAQPPG
jgi:hypothetical protein